MSKQNNNVDEAKTDSLSDAAIRRSLLGCAGPADQAKFEALMMLDDEFERRVYRLELELADDFSFGQLSTEEQKLFTSRFLVTPDRVRGLTVSEALRKAVSTESADYTTQAAQRSLRNFLNLFAFGRPLASAALAGAALLLFGTLIWLSLKAPPVRQQVSSKQKPTPNSEKQYAHPVAPQSPGDKSAPDSNTAKQQVPTITLQPESKSEHKQTVQLSNPGGEIASIRVEMVIDVTITAGTTYEAKLISADGLKVASFSELKVQPGDQSQVVLDIPARLLKNGSYCVELKQNLASGNDEFERYCFEVRQEQAAPPQK
ncbi:MAG TPA: hypothetical protein VFH15_12070 [Pyrinomonadaceae bacterium]|nr:hypothetical protein [Pyrinomonadaceae bacterium]